MGTKWLSELRVVELLLGDGWHRVDRESFAVHEDEYFSFKEPPGHTMISGPLASIVATESKAPERRAGDA